MIFLTENLNSIKKTPIIGGIILIINFSIIFFYQIFFLNNFLSLKLETFQSLELLSLIILIYSYFFWAYTMINII